MMIDSRINIILIMSCSKAIWNMNWHLASQYPLQSFNITHNPQTRFLTLQLHIEEKCRRRTRLPFATHGDSKTGRLNQAHIMSRHIVTQQRPNVSQWHHLVHGSGLCLIPVQAVPMRQPIKTQATGGPRHSETKAAQRA